MNDRRRLGDLSPTERQAVIDKALAALKAELESPEFAATLDATDDLLDEEWS